MSLQVWLPLNGNLDNKGVGTLSSAFSISSPTYSAGKMGNNLKISSQQSNIVTVNELANKKNVTISFWFCVNSGNAFQAWRDMITFGVSNGSTTSDFRLEVTNSTGNRFGWFGNNFLTTDSGCLWNDVDLDTWYHLTLVLNGTTIREYINGELQEIFIIPASYANNYYFTGTMSLGDYNMYVSLADVRVYDECLSVKQIKEIAKGLVVHYPLNSGYGNENLVRGSSTIDTSLDHFREEATITSEKYLGAVVATTNGAWRDIGVNLTNIIKNNNLTAGDKITFSVYHKTTDTAEKGYHFFCSTTSASNPISFVTKDMGWFSKCGWHRFITTITITNSMMEAVESGNIINIRYEANAGSSSGTYEYWAASKVEIGNKATMWCPNKADTLYNTLGYNDTTIYNNANFENSLERVGDLVYSSDTPLYDSSINFNQTGYLKNSSFNLYADKMTVCFWVKIPETITAQHFLFSTHNNWPYNGVSMYRDRNSNFYSMIIKSDVENSYSSVSVSLDVDTWTFLTITYTGEQYKVYKNGILYNTTTYGSGGRVHNPVLYLGNSLYSGTLSSETDEASMSDFRMYSTVLSDTDIKRLYQSRAKIDKTGTLYCNQFIEDTNTTNLLEDYSFPTVSTDNTGKVAFSSSLIDCSDSVTGKATKIVCTSDCLGFWYNANSWVTARSKFIVGKQYIWSIYIKSDNRTNIIFSVECSSAQTKNNFVIDNNYRRIEGIFTYSDSTQWSSFTCYPTFSVDENIYIHTFCVEECNPKVNINSKGITQANSFTEIESEKKCKIYKQNIQSTEIIEE